MKCPNGHEAKQIVVESRQGEEQIYRKRACVMCGVGYHTKEEIFVGAIPNAARKPPKKKAATIHSWAGW